MREGEREREREKERKKERGGGRGKALIMTRTQKKVLERTVKGHLVLWPQGPYKALKGLMKSLRASYGLKDPYKAFEDAIKPLGVL